MEKTIELDCPPGLTRPGDLISNVVEGTILEPLTTPENTAGRLFGNWTWVYPQVSDEDWKTTQPIIKERITRLYQRNIIRYGSW